MERRATLIFSRGISDPDSPPCFQPLHYPHSQHQFQLAYPCHWVEKPFPPTQCQIMTSATPTISAALWTTSTSIPPCLTKPHYTMMMNLQICRICGITNCRVAYLRIIITTIIRLRKIPSRTAPVGMPSQQLALSPPSIATNDSRKINGGP